MVRIALIYPPGGDPRAPRLPLPALAAALRPEGIGVTLFDLDLEGVLSLLRPGALQQAGAILRGRARGTAGEAGLRLGQLGANAADLAARIDDALATLRDPVRFHDPVQLNAARERIYDALDLVSAAAPRPLRYQTDVLRYDVDGVDPSRFSDLLAVTADPGANLFEDHWAETVYSRLEAGAGHDLVGISLTLRWQLIPGLSLARRLRQRGHRVVLGGTALAKISDQLAGLPEFFDVFADGVVTREGETALRELAEQLQGTRDFARVPNFLYAAGGRVQATPTHIEAYASLPTPDFEGLPLDRYLSPHLVLPVMVGKGCYHDECTFCDIPFINRVSPKRYRVRDADTVADDIATLSERHGCRHFLLADEALPPKVLDRLAGALERRGTVGLAFSGYARLEPGFTPELCGRLSRVGLRKLYFGLESADQATLDGMKKGIRVENARSVLGHCRDAGIRFHVFSMIGLPGEHEASAQATIRFFEENAGLFDDPGNTFDIHELEILTDTPYFARASDYGIRIDAPLEGRDLLFGIGTAWENMRGLSRADITRLLGEAGERIGRRFARYHAWPPILWPAQEEWSLCYADRYFGAPFLHRLSVPDDEARSVEAPRFRLAWNQAARVEAAGEMRIVTSRRGRVELDQDTYALLGEDPRYRSPAEILESLSGPRANVGETRTILTELVRSRLLDVVPRGPGMDATAPVAS